MGADTTHHQAIIKLPTAWLVDRLQLPPGTVIEAAEMGFYEPGTLCLRIRGAGFPPLGGGGLIGGPPVRPMDHIQVDEDGRRTETVVWPFQEEHSHG